MAGHQTGHKPLSEPMMVWCTDAYMFTWPRLVDIITVTSQWARWHLKSPASRLFIQPFIQAQIKNYSTVYSGADQRTHQSSTSLAFVWGIHRWPVNSLHKWPVTRKMFPFDDVIMMIKVSCHGHANIMMYYQHVESKFMVCLTYFVDDLLLISQKKW